MYVYVIMLQSFLFSINLLSIN